MDKGAGAAAAAVARGVAPGSRAVIPAASVAKADPCALGRGELEEALRALVAELERVEAKRDRLWLAVALGPVPALLC
jgi:hypothetical protein